MNILRTDVSVINKFLQNFKELFSSKQFQMFTMFVYAMLKDINASTSPLFPRKSPSITKNSGISSQTPPGIITPSTLNVLIP